jgi:hypothetical protein
MPLKNLDTKFRKSLKFFKKILCRKNSDFMPQRQGKMCAQHRNKCQWQRHVYQKQQNIY